MYLFKNIILQSRICICLLRDRLYNCSFSGVSVCSLLLFTRFVIVFVSALFQLNMPQKWMLVAQEKHHKEHLERVKNMRCSVDCGPPREKMEKNRTVEKARKGFVIERNNRILLDRLGVALERKNIDNENAYYLEKHEDRKNRHSALSGKAQIELAKITADNKLLLKRIEHVEPTYSFNQFEAEEVLHRKHLMVLTDFPSQYAVDPQLSNSITRNISNQQLLKNMSGNGESGEDFQYMYATPVFSKSNSKRALHHTRRMLLPEDASSSSSRFATGMSSTLGSIKKSGNSSQELNLDFNINRDTTSS